MNRPIPLSDDELRAAGEVLRYVKEALADMALSSIRERGTAVIPLYGRKRSLCLDTADRPGDRPLSLVKLFGDRLVIPAGRGT